MNACPGKRVLDFVAAGTASLAFAPVVAGVAPAEWLEDGGLPLFAQPRIARGRQAFTILKFRSMGESQAPVGQWLRRTRIDELPQFVNVYRGAMSLLGPRPLVSRDIERLGWPDAGHDWRFAAMPGITGLSPLLASRGSRASERLDHSICGDKVFSSTCS